MLFQKPTICNKTAHTIIASQCITIPSARAANTAAERQTKPIIIVEITFNETIFYSNTCFQSTAQ